MVGIEKLKSDIVTVSKIFIKLDKSLEDDKISIREGIGLAMMIPSFMTLVKGYKESVEELKDLDESEKEELVNHFNSEFELTNKEAEEIVEKIFDVIVSTATLLLAEEEIIPVKPKEVRIKWEFKATGSGPVGVFMMHIDNGAPVVNAFNTRSGEFLAPEGSTIKTFIALGENTHAKVTTSKTDKDYIAREYGETFFIEEVVTENHNIIGEVY